jgi:hypothetical protein
VGLGVLVETADEFIFLMNLYRAKPTSVSNAMLLGVARYALESGLRLDAMRGAFGLKARYGFRPQPRYAVVNDPAWKVRPQTDLQSDALLALYGRPFGYDQGVA